MSWTDRQSIKVIKHLRDKFKVKVFIESGTFKGINAKLHSKNFNLVLTCENNSEYYDIARKRLENIKNTICYPITSPKFCELIKNNYKGKDIIMFYLDAHFYNPKLPKNKRFVILDELKALKNMKNCIIIIHDFDNGLGHITYDGISLNLQLIQKDLLNVNPNFYLYTNELSSCDIVKPNYNDIISSGLDNIYDVVNNLTYAWKEPRLTYRGILYALPKKLTDKEIKLLGLKYLPWITNIKGTKSTH